MFLDELSAGILPASTAELRAAFGVSPGLAAAAVLTTGQVLAFLLEPFLFRLADRHPRRPFVCAGLLVTGAACILAGLASSWTLLLAALLIEGPACGCGVGLAQATLADAHAEDRNRAMARWGFFGCVGDLGSLALLPLLAAVSLGWRAALVLCGCALAAQAMLLARTPFPAPKHSEEADPQSAARSVRGLLRNRELLVWTAAAFLCCLLDETLIAFGTLHLSERLHATLAVRTLVFAASAAGGAVGTGLLARVVSRVEPLRLLKASSAACVLLYVAWIWAPWVWASVALMFAVGLLSSAFHPLAMSRVYASAPGRSGSATAVGALLAPLEMAIPAALAWTANRWGLAAAMLLLALEPLGVLCAAVLSTDRA